MTESDFRRWVMRNFRELKEHVLTQWKETKNLEKRFEEMITRMDNLERIMSELKELKNTTWEHREASTRFNSRTDQAEERISEVKDQLNEIKREAKIRKIMQKGMNKVSKKCGTMWRDLIYVWLVYLNVMKRINPSWKIPFRILYRKISPTKQGMPILKSRKYRDHHKDIPQEEQPQGT